MHNQNVKRLVAKLKPKDDRPWYQINNKADDDLAEIHIYDEIGWWGVTAQNFLNDLKGITATRINLHVNSPGGEIFDGIAIHNALKFHSAKVTVYVDSLAASIASVIAMAGDEIVMRTNSQMMIHDGIGGVYGNAGEMREMADLLDKQSDNIAAIYADRTGKEVAHWRGLMLEETWFTAQEAVDAGLADRVQTSEDFDKELEEAMGNWDLTQFNNAPEGLRNSIAALQEAEEVVPEEGEELPSDNSVAPVTNSTDTTNEPVEIDPDLFRAGVARAANQVFEFGWDPAILKSAIAGVANDAAAPTVREPAPPVSKATRPAPEPVVEPEKEEPGWDPDLFKAVVGAVANDAPAPTVAPVVEGQPELIIDMSGLRDILRKAAKS